jgi:hypothetical protein
MIRIDLMSVRLGIGSRKIGTKKGALMRAPRIALRVQASRAGLI